MADDVRGRPEGRFADGIMMHRRIDSFVDAHPATIRSIALLPTEYRRYGGIMLDVLHDHFLAVEWTDRSVAELSQFAGQVYRTLREGEADLPENFRLRMPRMVANRWLESFHEFETVDRILRHLSTRLRRENPLPTSAAIMHPLLDDLQSEFQILLPDTVAYARNLEPGAVWTWRE